MTREEFLAKLTEVKDQFNWKITPGYTIRGNVGEYYCDYCPITAVYYSMTKTYISPDHVDTAWKRMDIHEDVAEEIVRAADATCTWRDDAYDKELRNEMRIILGFGPAEGIYI